MRFVPRWVWGAALLLGGAAAADAAKPVRIATLGGRPAGVAGASSRAMTDAVLQFWRRQLRPVLPDQPDLIVLPEAADTPLAVPRNHRAEFLQERKDRVLDYFEGVAREHHCYLVFGSIHLAADGLLRNSSILIDRGGRIVGSYDKNFPAVYEMEAGIVPGATVQAFACDFGRVAMAICFDLNFPELMEKVAALKPDLVLFSSAYHGGLVQAQWAYGCRTHFVGAIGSPKTPSEILDPLGRVVATSTNYFDYAVATVNLDCRLAHLDYNRERLVELKKKYGPAVTIADPGRLGCVLISSNSPKIGVATMVDSVHLELLDDYFDRSRSVRRQRLPATASP